MERERVDIGVGRIGRCATRKSNERIPHPVESSKNRIAPPKTAETEDSRDRGPSRVHNTEYACKVRGYEHTLSGQPTLDR